MDQRHSSPYIPSLDDAAAEAASAWQRENAKNRKPDSSDPVIVDAAAAESRRRRDRKPPADPVVPPDDDPLAHIPDINVLVDDDGNPLDDDEIEPKPQSGNGRARPGALVLSPNAPLVSARRFIQQHHIKAGQRALHHQQDAFYAWRGTHYAEVAEEVMRGRLYAFLDKAVYRPRPGRWSPSIPTSQRSRTCWTLRRRRRSSLRCPTAGMARHPVPSARGRADRLHQWPAASADAQIARSTHQHSCARRCGRNRGNSRERGL